MYDDHSYVFDVSTGMAGFARLVPGDVFEVVIKHGGQKWKTKGRIEKNNTQRWDSPEYTFKCLVGETLNIKVSFCYGRLLMVCLIVCCLYIDLLLVAVVLDCQVMHSVDQDIIISQIDNLGNRH